MDDMRPFWNETAYILVSPEEVNASERLRVQLWDSDRTSADDDLGRIEVDLKQLMSDSRSFCRMWHREDGFQALTPSEDMPGNLVWKVGYFPKERIQQEQLERQSLEPEVKSIQQLKDNIARDVGQKMREASNPQDSPEFKQQEAQDLKTREGTITQRAGLRKLSIKQITWWRPHVLRSTPQRAFYPYRSIRSPGSNSSASINIEAMKKWDVTAPRALTSYRQVIVP